MAEQSAEILAVAHAARALEQHEAALLLYRRVRELDDKNLEALAAIAELSELIGDAGETVAARLALVEHLVAASELERAAAVIEQILAVAPDEPAAQSFKLLVEDRLRSEVESSGEATDAAPKGVDDQVTARVEVPDPPAVATRAAADDEDEDDMWEARTNTAITASDVRDILAESAPRESGSEDLEVETIAVDGPGAELAVAELIEKSPLLRSLDAASCSRLLADGEVLQCFAGQEVVEQGTRGSSLFLLLDGEAAIERHGERFESLAPGAFFGEAALIGDTPRLATLRAISDATLLEIDRALVKKLSASQPRMVPVLGHFLRARAIKLQMAESPVLSRVPRALVGELAPLFHLHKVRRGQEVVSCGRVPSGYWEVVVGLLEAVDSDGAAGSDLSAGGGFGRGSLVEQPSPVTLTAITSCWLLELPVGDLRKMIERYPRLAETLGPG